MRDMLSRKQRLMRRRQNAEKERRKSSKKSIKKEKKQRCLEGNDSCRNQQAQKEIKGYEDLRKKLEGYVEVNNTEMIYGGQRFNYDILEGGEIRVYSQGNWRIFTLQEPDFREGLVDFIGGMG